MNEDENYENIIAKYNEAQLIYEEALIDEQETILYNRKKALKEERKRRLNEKIKGN